LNLNHHTTEEPTEVTQTPLATKIVYPATMNGILTKKTLSLAIADEIATLAIQACKNNGFKPISVCVMDPSGYEIVTKRMDGCPVSILNSPI
jgi:ABC-type phosphate transport system permease subunit